ncbi:MAG: leader peptide processing enzyme [Sphaerochaetaceae bacterium]|jgi:hypothetical protein
MIRKKVNTVLFVLGATLINLIIMVVFLVVGLFIIARLVPQESPLSQLLLGLVIIGSIGGSFAIYLKVVKKAIERYNLKEHLDPIFFRKRGDKRRERNNNFTV